MSLISGRAALSLDPVASSSRPRRSSAGCGTRNAGPYFTKRAAKPRGVNDAEDDRSNGRGARALRNQRGGAAVRRRWARLGAVLQQPSESLQRAPAWTAAQRAAARGGILQRAASGRVHRDPRAILRA